MQTHEIKHLHCPAVHVVFGKRDWMQNHLVAYLPVDGLLEEERQRGRLLVLCEVVPELHDAFEPEIESVRQNSEIKDRHHFLLEVRNFVDFRLIGYAA